MLGVTGDDVKKLVKIAAPMTVVSLIRYTTMTTTMAMVGHLHSQLYLSAISLAFIIARITAYNLQVGLAGALETLAGQAHGAKQYKKVGILTQTAILSQLVICLPICVAWSLMEKLLVLTHQDPSVAMETGKFLRWLLPLLFSEVLIQPLVRYFQCQGFTLPMTVSTIVSSCAHLPVSWLLIFRFRLGFLGSALALDIAAWMQIFILVLFFVYSPVCSHSRTPLSSQALRELPAFFRLALPSALMHCLEYWSLQAIILMAGYLYNPKLEISVLSLSTTTLGLLDQIPFGIGCGVSTRVSNELGAGNPHGARAAIRASLLVTVTQTTLATSLLFFARRFIGHIYTKDSQVVAYFSNMAPLVCISLVLDSLIYVLIGTVRGCGLQKMVTYINFGAYFLCGIPVAVLLGFVFHRGGKGLWCGILVGAFIQVVAISIFIYLTNLDKQATKARERLDAEVMMENVIDHNAECTQD